MCVFFGFVLRRIRGLNATKDLTLYSIFIRDRVPYALDEKTLRNFSQN
jgi:hypothetical protein